LEDDDIEFASHPLGNRRLSRTHPMSATILV
jgi:hypothetical protein